MPETSTAHWSFSSEQTKNEVIKFFLKMQVSLSVYSTGHIWEIIENKRYSIQVTLN